MYLTRLRDLREDSDMTQQQIAELLGTKQTIYSRYERGYQNIPLEFLLTLADYMTFLLTTSSAGQTVRSSTADKA